MKNNQKRIIHDKCRETNSYSVQLPAIKIFHVALMLSSKDYQQVDLHLCIFDQIHGRSTGRRLLSALTLETFQILHDCKYRDIRILFFFLIKIKDVERTEQPTKNY